jgi:hypothetical protein
MDPVTIALATFGIQKLRGKSTKRAFRDAAIAGTLGQVGGMAGIGNLKAFGQAGQMPSMFASGNYLGDIGGAGSLSLGQQFSQQTLAGRGLSSLMGDKPMPGAKDFTPEQIAKTGKTQEQLIQGSGFRSFSPGTQLGIGAALTTALAGDGDPAELPEGTRPEDYEEAKKKADEQLQGILNKYDYEADAAGITQSSSPYDYGGPNSMYTFNKGGIAEIKKFNSGGINYLPSMIDHDKNDVNNYVRATGYVEDGSGNGDKDEDTMLAQLADGEFVSRADAILGAGIMEGANPESFKDMRKKGAAFFYGQQAKFKRIFDLLDEAKKKTN